MAATEVAVGRFWTLFQRGQEREVEDGWPLDGQVGGLRSFHDAINVAGGLPEEIREVGTIAHQATRVRELGEDADRRQAKL